MKKTITKTPILQIKRFHSILSEKVLKIVLSQVGCRLMDEQIRQPESPFIIILENTRDIRHKTKLPSV